MTLARLGPTSGTAEVTKMIISSSTISSVATRVLTVRSSRSRSPTSLTGWPVCTSNRISLTTPSASLAARTVWFIPLRPLPLICDAGRAPGREQQPQPFGQELDQQELAGRVGPRQPATQLQGPLHPGRLQRRDRQLAQPGRHPEQILRPAAGERLAQRLALEQRLGGARAGERQPGGRVALQGVVLADYQPPPGAVDPFQGQALGAERIGPRGAGGVGRRPPGGGGAGGRPGPPGCLVP